MSGFNGQGAAIEAGTVQSFAGAVPNGWLPCNGAAVSRGNYANLYLAIGDTYGAGDASATFNVPGLRGEIGRGLCGGRGVVACWGIGG